MIITVGQSGNRFAEDKLPAIAAHLVVGETFLITSSVLRENRRINVYFPPGFSARSEKKLPVLYMLDGGMEEDFLHVAGLVQVSVGNATMRPFLLIGIENTERRRDLTGPTTNPQDQMIAPRVGGSQKFRSFLKSELIPEVRRRYQTTSESAIVGESLAGLFVVETFLLEPELFDTFFAFDPSLWWNRGKLLGDAPGFLKEKSHHGKSLLLATSHQPDISRSGKQLHEILEKAKIPGLRYELVPMPAESHETIFHPAALMAFRKFLAPPLKTPDQ